VADQGTRWLRGRLALYGFLLALLLSLAIGAILIYLDDNLDSDAILSSIGLNLIASVIFALIFSWISGGVQQRILLDNLQDAHTRTLAAQRAAAAEVSSKVDDLSKELLQKLSGYEKHYMPTATYGASDRPDRTYNEAVTASFAATKAYQFRGTSAKYVPLHLKRVPRGRLRTVKIIMLDPRANEAVGARAATRIQQRGDDASLDVAKAAIQEEILMSLVALFDCRHLFTVDIAFVQDVPAARIELFDEEIYLSWYQGPASATKRFPESLMFNRGTFLYEMLSQEFYGRYELGEKISFSRNDGAGRLLTVLEELTGRAVTNDEVRTLRNNHAISTEEVEAILNGE
jgi:hypothetical protein